MSQQHSTNGSAASAGSGKRKCTPDELAAIARANGAHSRGPTSSEGVEACRRARQTHGLRSEPVAMETEDAAALARNTQRWFDVYQPRSPAANMLVNICAVSDIMINRGVNFLGAISKTNEEASGVAWEESREKLTAECVADIPARPAEAIVGLRGFGHGCLWLLGRWTEFQTALLSYGYWPEAVWPSVVRLLGADPDFDRIGASSQAFTTALYNLWCQPRPDREQIEKLSAPARRPPELRHLRPEALNPEPEQAREWLLDMIAAEIRELQALERAHRQGIDKIERAEVLRQALLPREDEGSRQFLRYFHEWTSKSLRAIGQLPKIAERDASGFWEKLAADTAPADDPPPDPAAPHAEGAETREGAMPPRAPDVEPSNGRRDASDALTPSADFPPDPGPGEPIPAPITEGPSGVLITPVDVSPDPGPGEPIPAPITEGPSAALTARAATGRAAPTFPEQPGPPVAPGRRQWPPGWRVVGLGSGADEPATRRPRNRHGPPASSRPPPKDPRPLHGCGPVRSGIS
jgi:hypothetical protein